MSTPAVTPQGTPQGTPQPDQDQTQQAAPQQQTLAPAQQQTLAPVNMVAPDGSDARQIPADQADAAKQSGWEPAVKMYNGGDQTDQRWIPVSKIDAAKGAGYYPVLNQKTKSAVEGDAIKDDPVGNAILTAGGSGLLKAGEAAGEAMLDPAATAIDDFASEAGKQVADKAGLAAEYAEHYGKAAAESAANAAKWVKSNPVSAGLAYHLARNLGVPLPKVLDLLSHLGQ
jgi:hypothetical protein